MTGSRKIYVGLSGGVDSAVSAALLKEAGHAVTGVFIRTWHPEGFPCSEGEDEREAMRVASHLDIPFKTLDLSKRYKDEVANYFIEGYKIGETPNPDILCNREVKFGGFVEFARSEGADGIATGHYARLEIQNGVPTLQRGVDENKDQSYFLSLVPLSELSYAQFPLGGMKKSEVRKLAEQFHLPNANRKDSQGICFLGAIDLKEFLSKFIEVRPGDVLSKDGKKIGMHQGASLYTLGQRHGFLVEDPSFASTPLYVQETNSINNTITVVPKENLTGSTEFILRDENVLTAFEGICEIQTRYHMAPVKAEIKRVHGQIVVLPKSPVVGAPGQTLAIYQGDSLCAAGVISKAIHI